MTVLGTYLFGPQGHIVRTFPVGTDVQRRIKSAAPISKLRVVEQYHAAKKEYQDEMKKAQTSSWRTFCEKLEQETMWDGIYRVIGRTEIRKEEIPFVCDGKNMGNIRSAEILAEAFYPEAQEEKDEKQGIKQQVP